MIVIRIPYDVSQAKASNLLLSSLPPARTKSTACFALWRVTWTRAQALLWQRRPLRPRHSRSNGQLHSSRFRKLTQGKESVSVHSTDPKPTFKYMQS